MLTLLRKLKTSLNQFVEDGELSSKEYRKLLELEKKGFLGGLLGA
jgi:ribosomal protein L19E